MPATCKTHGPGTAIDENEWLTGAHMLSCGCSPCRLRRHNQPMRRVLKPIYKGLGYDFDERDVHCHLSTLKRVDARCRNSAVSHNDEALDFTVGCPRCDSYITPRAAEDRNHVTGSLERAKHSKHAAAAAANGMRLVVWAGTTYGGWGAEWRRKHLDPEFARRMREEKKEGGSGWETIKWRQRLYEDMCIEVARANYAMLKERTLPPRVA